MGVMRLTSVVEEEEICVGRNSVGCISEKYWLYFSLRHIEGLRRRPPTEIYLCIWRVVEV